MAQKAHSLSHTKWLCKYHIVFTLSIDEKLSIINIEVVLERYFDDCVVYKGVEIIEGHLMPDHVHMLISIPPRLSVSSFMGYLKGKSALTMFDKHANLKYKFGNRHFWAESFNNLGNC
ncbi:IS200/IS605 family transposase [Streptococcus suis]|uniref:IS200/IS605 family transposase n=1 Tax=Streptococcus suis TaxID=1307 RepID=UPI001C949418|nr:IS200/IS605 family transposase [Streptococcus suis]MBY4956929.1 IS200/IS605 family transposase [Streptococcus suis]MBY4971583.1 IS200/IS605 family transposase [Streptococcus suis]MBY4993411.1 IS200/IS605 family transposase [Streptococcus suis]MBY5008877.1 IS200/IS605 family transposase [Streptococcus suis]MBY5033345.1 IS200/IS605 family transposase [Streptococcus suis]